jgi:AcrR family transcriptional regulator
MGSATPTRRREIIDAGRALLEQVGIESFSLRELGVRVGMRAPSLYRHFADKQAIFLALVGDGFADLATVLERAEPSLAALAQAYRRFALANPELYRLMYDRPLPREHLPQGITTRAFAPILSVCGGSIVEARVAWAFAHGATSLELARRFPPGGDLDAAWHDGISRIEKPNRKRR